MTTTPKLIRNAIVAAIESIVPTSESAVRFIEHKHDEGADVEDWARQYPESCLRRFTVRYTGDREQPEVSNTDVESEERDFEVTVVYPSTNRWADAMGRDDVIDEDAERIDMEVGTNSYAGGAMPATMLSAGWTRIDGTPATVLVISLRAVFYRARAA